MSPRKPKHSHALEESLGNKVRDFAIRMTRSDAKNLHPLVIRAVERPLITQILIEMNWNQVQAAQTLGINRNTLRKKIHDLKINRPKTIDMPIRKKS